MNRIRLRLYFTILMLGSVCTLWGQLPEDFYETEVSGDFTFPMGLTFDHEGRMFVWEKAGKVQIMDTSGTILPEPLIDISEEVMNWKDNGLTGFALDPDFETNGYFYLLYAADLHYLKFYGTAEYHPDSMTTNTATIGRVTRYTADPASGFTQVLEGSRKILIGETLSTGIPLMYAFHGLGTLIFGNDNTLLISCGDATSNGGIDIGGDSLGTFVSAALEDGIIAEDQDIGSYKSQYLGSYSGKVIRIDPETGDGLASNPFYDAAAPRSPQSRIWALGFRNPYRISVKPNTGSHYPEDGDPGTIMVGDVGNGKWEELNIVKRGGQNFGWPIFEGNGRMWGFQVADVPENKMAPNPLFGAGCDQEYFNFRDLLSRPQKEEDPVFSNPCDPFQEIPVSAFPMVESLATLVWNNSKWNPPARAIIPGFGDDGGVASFDINTTESGVQGEHFEGYSSLAGAHYDATVYPEAYQGSYFAVDFSGWIRQLEFDENDKLLSVQGFHDNATDIIHLALNPHDGLLYYIDLFGKVKKIAYGGNPPPVAKIQASQTYGPGPLTVSFDASESFDSNLPIVSYAWDFGDGSTSDAMQVEHTFTSPTQAPTSYTVTLTVADSLGATAQTSVIVSLNNTPPDARISSFEDGAFYPLDRTTLLRLAAEVSDAEHATDDLQYEWRVFFHHNEHFHPEPVDMNPLTYTLISPLGCQDELYWYRIELTVTDPAGLSTVDSREIYPYCDGPFIAFAELMAETQETSIKLDWELEIEEDVVLYEVQRSSDFYHFESIGRVDPMSSGFKYSFEDTTPLRGNNIYRIKAQKQDGAYDYSNFATANYPLIADIRVYPNPAGEAFEIDIKEAEAGIIGLELFNVAGIRLLNTQWPAEVGENFKKTILTGQLNNGMYFYKITNGKEELAGSLLIAK